MNEMQKKSVWVWTHSSELAGELSRRIYELGYPLSDSLAADIAVIGPSIGAEEIRAKKGRLKGKRFILLVDETENELLGKTSSLFNVVSTAELSHLADILRIMTQQSGFVEDELTDMPQRVIDILGMVEAVNPEKLWQRLFAILQTLPLGIIIIDENVGILVANEKTHQILHTTDEIVGMSFEDFCAEYGFSAQGIHETLESLHDSARPPAFSHNFLDARVTKIFLAAIPNSDEYLLLLDDVTETRRESEWLQTLLGAIGDGVLVIDRSRRIIWSNHIMKEWFGEKLEQERRYCFSLWGSGKDICPHCQLDRVFDGCEIFHYTERLVNEAGEEKYFDVTAAPIRSAGDSVYQVVLLARDATEREMMIHELISTRRSLESVNLQIQRQYTTLRTIIEISDTLQRASRLDKILHIILTAVTAREGLGFNRAFLLLVNNTEGILEGKYAIGPSSPEEAGRIWAELSDGPTSLAETLHAYQEATQKEDTLVNNLIQSYNIPLDTGHFLEEVLMKGEMILVSPGNKELWEKASDVREHLGSDEFGVIPLLSMTRPVGILIVDNMITRRPIIPEDLELLRSIINHASLAIERSALTEELQGSYEKIESAYASLRENQDKLVKAEKLSTIGEMAAQVAHEIRNPLVSIGGFAQSLITDKISEPQTKALKIILEETDRLEKIVNDVLGFASLSEPKMEINDINRAIYDALLLFEPEFEENKTDASVVGGDGIPHFMFDHNQIRQVLINLIRNSLNVIGENGKITVRVKHDGKYCWLEFTDNGPGIPKELGDKIFQPFFTTETKGSGLGLSISARIVKSHNGTIWYKNNPDGGVTFFIRLPLHNVPN